MKKITDWWGMLVLVLCCLFGCSAESPFADDVFENEFIRGDFAYVPSGSEVLKVDISDPQRPQIIYTSGLQLPVVHLDIERDHFYASRRVESTFIGQTTADSGVIRFDVSGRIPISAGALNFPAIPTALLVQDDLLFASGIDETIIAEIAQPLSSAQVRHRLDRSYNSFLWHADTLLAGGGFCNFRSGYCEGWLDAIKFTEDEEAVVVRLYAGDVPIFDMETVGGRLVTLGRNIMIAPLDQLDRFPAEQVEYAGGYYSGVTVAADDGVTFYQAENHEILIWQFNESDLPTLIGRESSAPVGTFFSHLAVKDSHLYAVSEYGLHVFDVSDPTHPFGIGFTPLDAATVLDAPLLPQPSPTPIN